MQWAEWLVLLVTLAGLAGILVGAHIERRRSW